jgi:poly-gamma-glutamate synthesis protein (capsule biosynthesis protein)
MPAGDGLLCALDRRDAFLELQPASTGVRTAAYRWQGFGFAGVEDAEVLERCRLVLGVPE